MSLAAGIKKAQTTDTEKLVDAFSGLSLMTPFGTITYRPEDHQSTMGSFVGRTKNDGGKGVMVDFRFLDGAKFLPSAEEVKKLRPAQ
jgi:branched-chain amino acid transport system substrate-binding protein